MRKSCVFLVVVWTALAGPAGIEALSGVCGGGEARCSAPVSCRCCYPTKPGVLCKQKGKWIGRSDLGGVPREFPVRVEIVVPPFERLALTEEGMERWVNRLLSRAEINRDVIPARLKPKAKEQTHQKEKGAVGVPPVLCLVLFIEPWGDVYAVHADLRLLEEGGPRRACLDGGECYQVITWERQTSFVTAKYDLCQSVGYHTDRMLSDFIKQFHFDKKMEPIRKKERENS